MEKLFFGISEEDRNRMSGCLSFFTKKYKKGEIIEDLSYGSELAGLVTRGKCILRKTDQNGNESIVERYDLGDVFAKSLSFFDTAEDSYTVVASQNCEIVFFDNRKMMSPCGNCCGCHLKFMNNIMEAVLRRSGKLGTRIEILSQKNTREKLMKYFKKLSARQQSREISLPITMAELADYLGVNRSAMTREVKKMREEGIIEINKKTIRLK